VVCKGRVTDRYGENGRYFAELELWAENQKGELVMKGQSQIQPFYSLEDETRQRAGQAPILVSIPRQSLLTPPPPPPPPAAKPPAPVAEKPVAAAKKVAAREKPVAKKASIKGTSPTKSKKG
jgi:hypothetical protein